jgi:hypothetical protein
MDKIARSWSLMADCWRVLRQDKKLLLFPLLSGICCLALLASFAIPLYATGAWEPPARDAAASRQVAYYGMLFLFYFCNYMVIVFFNAGIVACATIRMDGGEPSIGDGFRAAASRLPVIIGWVLIAATVGLILRIVEDWSDKVGRIVAGVLGMAWTLVSFLAVPVLVVENKNPIAALKDSAALLKKTWGEQLTAHFSFGMITALLTIPAFAMVFVGLLSGKMAAVVVCIALAVVYLILLALVQSALQSIFQVALFLYARGGRVPEGFREESLSGAMS